MTSLVSVNLDPSRVDFKVEEFSYTLVVAASHAPAFVHVADESGVLSATPS